MDNKEKAKLLCGKSSFGTRGSEELGIKGLLMTDGGTGINFEQLLPELFGQWVKEKGYGSEQFYRVIKNFYRTSELTEDEQALREELFEKLKEYTGGFEPHPGCYPPGILLGSTWNGDAVNKVARVLGLEAAMYKIDCLLGTPNVNLLRDPRGGRFFEGYSEDPYLAGALAEEMTRGVEAAGVASDVKHYAANNLEINRVGINETISRRALEEMYLPGFEACVKAGAATVMAAYVKINGEACTQSRFLLREILRERWGFKGLTVTDWGACTGDTGESVAAGMDLFMPGPWEHEDEILNALEDGRLCEDELDEACEHYVALCRRAGENKECVTNFDDYVSRGNEACYEADREGFVLLKNNGILPVEDMRRVRLEGEPELMICGSGSAQVFTDRAPALVDVFKGAGASVGGDEGGNTDISLVVVSVPSSEGSDRPDLKMPEQSRDLINKLISAGRRIILVLNTPGPVEIEDFIESIDVVMIVYYPGMTGAQALCDMIEGKVSPSGHLPFSYPVRYEDTPAFMSYPDSFSCTYGEGIFVGYRGYGARRVKPLFPFGHGLTYTSFAISGAAPSRLVYGPEDTIRVAFELENTGECEGSQVVQLYSSDPVSQLIKPPLELRAFSKITLEAGQKTPAQIEFKASQLAAFYEDYGEFMVEDGVYELYLGFSSEDIRACVVIRIKGGDSRLRPGPDSRLSFLVNHKELMDALESDIRARGEDIQLLYTNLQYTPYVRLREVYPNASSFEHFMSRCGEYEME